MKAVEVKDLKFAYGKKSRNVLDGLDFSCDKGSVNVLLGLNGSGKTTLIKILAGLYENYTGEVSLFGRDLKKTSVEERSKMTAYVAQRSAGADDFTVRNYLLFGKVNKTKFYSSPSAKDREDTLRYAERFNISGLLDKNLGQLSGGERQIVGVCCAAVQDTDLIVLDEPTSALDIRNQHVVLSLIKEIAADEGKTFILSSHNPNHALCLGGEVHVIKDGRIAFHGAACETVTVEKMRTVYGDDVCLSKDLPYNEISFGKFR